MKHVDGDHNNPSVYNSAPTIKVEDPEENWNGDRQRNRKEDQLERNYYPPSPQSCPPYDFPDRLSYHYKPEKDRNERLGFQNDKYNFRLLFRL